MERQNTKWLSCLGMFLWCLIAYFITAEILHRNNQWLGLKEFLNQQEKSAVKSFHTTPAKYIYLQPFDNFDESLLQGILPKLINIYPEQTFVVRPSIKLPKSTFYEPRQRYRADKILDHLDENLKEGNSKLIGFTRFDISYTKNEEFPDWGIFGLGRMGGNVAVVSPFRLKKDNPSLEKLTRRLALVAAHEIGHTFGHPHNYQDGCLM